MSTCRCCKRQVWWCRGFVLGLFLLGHQKSNKKNNCNSRENGQASELKHRKIEKKKKERRFERFPLSGGWWRLVTSWVPKEGNTAKPASGSLKLFPDLAAFRFSSFQERWLTVRVWPRRKPGRPETWVLRQQLFHLGPQHQEGSPFSFFQFNERVLRTSGTHGLCWRHKEDGGMAAWRQCLLSITVSLISQHSSVLCRIRKLSWATGVPLDILWDPSPHSAHLWSIYSMHFVTPWIPLGSSVHGILQTRILVWVAISSSRGSSQPRDQTRVSCIAGRFSTTETPGKPTPHRGM